MVDQIRRFILLLLLLFITVWGFCLWSCSAFGSMSSIAISCGENPVVCAIQASQEQQILCWGKNSSIEQSSIPPLMGLSGGSGFMCGLQATGDNQAFCFRTNFSTNSSAAAAAAMNNLVPGRFQGLAYQSISAGETHVCALKRRGGSSSIAASPIDCWAIDQANEADEANLLNNVVSRVGNADQVVSGARFSCILDEQGAASCWGDDTFGIVSGVPVQKISRNAPKSKDQLQPAKIPFRSITAGAHHVCGIERSSRQARCWGSNDRGQLDSPRGIRFAILAAGSDHTCGIRMDTHEIQCWGFTGSEFRSGIPSKTDFLAIASGDGLSCGIREGNLLADCWGGKRSGNVPEYSPPPELFSPGICSSVLSCSSPSDGDGDGDGGFFTFNASNHGVPEVDGLCSQSRRICSPCASACPNGTFLSSPCSASEDRICVDCSLCASQECESWCSVALPDSSQSFAHEERSQKRRSILIMVSVSSGFLFIVVVLVVLRIRKMLSENVTHNQAGSTEMSNCNGNLNKDLIVNAEVQIFRLADLRDATNGFKEMNEIGRGRYGTVYKALLPDGTQLAVKRSSAARRIQFTNKEFESELEILCRMRHENLVNLVGYCDQMGERLLAYEFMSNGSLFEHLHEEEKTHSCPVATRWNVRIVVAAQAAKGLHFLHSSKPPVIHGNLKSSNVMLDRDWNARISDFGLLGTEYASFESGYGAPENRGRPAGGKSDGSDSKQEANGQTHPRRPREQDDVYSFGVVLLEILTGRKAVIGGVFDPPVRLVDWALPMISRGKFDILVDPICSSDLFSHSSSKQNVVRFAEIAESCLSSTRRPSMADVSGWLQDLVTPQQHHQNHHHHHQPISCIKFRDPH